MAIVIGLASAVAMLAACGGGGGGGGGSPPSPPPPSFVALDVAVAGPVSAGRVTSLPAGIDCGSRCRSDFAVDSAVTLTATAGAGARFEGWAGSCGGTAPTCVLTMARASSVSATFSAAPQSAAWGPVQLASELGASGDSSEPVLTAIDASGRVLAVWYQWSQPVGGPRRLMANRYLPGAGWGVPVEVAPAGPTRALLEPQLALDPASGQAMLAWVQREAPGATYTVQSRRFEPSAGWGPVQLVADRLGGLGLRVGMDGQGRSLAVWTFVEPTGVFKLQASRHQPGGPWSAPQRIGSDTSFDAYASLAVAPGGDALVVAGGFGSDLWSNRFSGATGTWGQAATVVEDSRTDRTLVYPEVAIDSSGRAVMVWNQLDTANGGTSTMVSRRYASGWAATDVPLGAATPITPSGSRSRPLLRMNRRGDVVAAWLLEDRSIQASLAPAGGPWTTPVAVKPASALIEAIHTVQGGIDGSGQVTIAWSQRDNSRPGPVDLLIAGFTPGGGWAPPALHESFTGRDEDAAVPSLAVAESGAGVLAWRQVFQDVGTRIVARHRELGR
jgi:Divergent InlB B-repeat domain